MSDGREVCEIKKIGTQDIDKYDEISRVLNVLGNKARFAILAVMSKYNEVCACELQPALGMPQPTITTHLRKMYDIGLLKRKEVWKYSYYFINPKYQPLVRDILKDQDRLFSTLRGSVQKDEVGRR